jgi:putative membrane protein
MRSLYPLLLLALLPLAACGTPGMAGSGGTTAGATAGTAAAATADLGDPEVLHVYITANAGEVLTTQPFLNDFQNADVRALGEMIVRDHTAANQRAEAMPIEPESNPVSMRKHEMAMATEDRLDDMEGAALDMAWLEAQIQMHQQTLQELNTLLIPNASNPALRAELEAARAPVQMHLERAQALHHSMM